MKNYYTKFIAFCTSIALVSPVISLQTIHAADAPTLKIATVSIDGEQIIPESQQNPDEQAADSSGSAATEIQVDLSVTNNSGFLVSSFGISYDPALIYKGVNIASKAAANFQVVSNPQEHLLWFMSAGGSAKENASDLAEDVLMNLTFTVSEQAQGGNLPINFLWEGLDGSSASWYTDKSNNMISTIQQNAVNGAVSIFGNSSLNYTDLRMNQETQQQLEVRNAAGQVLGWVSDDPTVADVSETGLVTAISAGECNVNALIDGELIPCHVVVNAADMYDITESEELTINNPKRDIVMEIPNAQGIATWLSSNPAAVKIDANGKLEIVQPGKDCSVQIFGTDRGSSTTYLRKLNIHYGDVAVEPTTQTDSSNGDDNNIMLGDADLNQVVNILDVIMINRFILGKASLSQQQQKAADFNQDGQVAPGDSLDTMKKIVGIIK